MRTVQEIPPRFAGMLRKQKLGTVMCYMDVLYLAQRRVTLQNMHITPGENMLSSTKMDWYLDMQYSPGKD